MYADRLEAEAAGRETVKDRVNGRSNSIFTRLHQVTGKRQRQDDKWEHDLFEDSEPKISSKDGRVDPRDLRLKLQKRRRVSQSERVAGSGMRDLREKLSGTMNTQLRNNNRPKSKTKVAKLATKSMAVEAPASQTRKAAANPATRKKSQEKADASVNGFLESLGLEKYKLSFQAEEVDMAALLHMTDEDLKAMGMPMGPRKKILLQLESRR